LTGIIPSSIGSLSHLYSLDLSFNQLNEAIPSSIGNLSTLQLFYLSSNQLSGNLPASICNLNNLIILQLGNNQLIGSIPINIGNLTRLLALSLENNQLSGSIPTTIKNLSNLEYLGLTANQLTGNIPDEIGNLLNLKSLSLRNNHFIGSFPEKILNLTNLEQLDLSENQFTGTIPIEIGKLTKLKWFRLFSNQFTGNIPASIGNLSSLNTLDLGSNQLKGSIPSSIGNLINLQWFFLEENQLTGNFNLSGIPAFATVILENNKFTFDGIESNVALIDSYSPQANLPLTNTAGVLSVNAGGTLTNNTYRWYKKNPTALVATNTGNANYTPNAAGTYFVQVTNNIATSLTLTSDDISVTLTNTPIFTTQPSNVTVCPNTGTSFTATATNAVSYQWQVKIGAADFANLNEGGVYANVTSSTLSISNAAGLNGYQYRCVAIGTEGGTNSETATLTVGTPQATLNLQSPEDDITAASPTKNALNISAANKIQANGKVIYQGAQSVVLRPGFEAQAGSTFTAQIGGCN
jgi:Leucine-rich repeat (LRR) protein